MAGLTARPVPQVRPPRQLGEPRSGAGVQTRRAQGSCAPAFPPPLASPQPLPFPREEPFSCGAVSLTPPTCARRPVPASPLCARHPYPRYPPSTHPATRSEALFAPRGPAAGVPDVPPAATSPAPARPSPDVLHPHVARGPGDSSDQPDADWCRAAGSARLWAADQWEAGAGPWPAPEAAERRGDVASLGLQQLLRSCQADRQTRSPPWPRATGTR